jgi:hypothetical protein
MRSRQRGSTGVEVSQRKDVRRNFARVRIPSRREECGCEGKAQRQANFSATRRRLVRVERIINIGKESNRLEEIEAGVIHSPESVYTEYPDPRREEWQTKILPVLKKIPIATLMRFSGRSRSMLLRTMAGRARPRRGNQELLKSILHRLGVI